MPNINKYQNIDEVEREAKKDYIDRHSPFISTAANGKAGEVHEVTVTVGKEYTHPDDLDHYIANISLFNGQTKVAESTFYAGSLGGQDKKGNTKVTFNIVFEKNAKLVAHAYCTKHGIWESDPVSVEIS